MTQVAVPYAISSAEDLRAWLDYYAEGWQQTDPLELTEHAQWMNASMTLFHPARRMAVDCNPLLLIDARQKEEDYKHNRAQAYADLGIDLFQIWEDDWRFKRADVLDRVSHRIRRPGLTAITLDDIVVMTPPPREQVLSIPRAEKGGRYLLLQEPWTRAICGYVRYSMEDAKRGFVRIHEYIERVHVPGVLDKVIEHLRQAHGASLVTIVVDLGTRDESILSAGFETARSIPPRPFAVFEGRRYPNQRDYDKAVGTTLGAPSWRSAPKVYDAGKTVLIKVL